MRMFNLKQSLRFLCRREPSILGKSELVLVCQDSCQPPIVDGFGSVQNICLNLGTYNKPKMCNTGVEAAQSPIIALLDSDRILPVSYFSRSFASLKKNEAISTWKMRQCIKPYRDHQIEAGNISTIPDNKSMNNEWPGKNAFSGNTIFWRDDYLTSGGMDEEFAGYGFADNDMVDNFQSHGVRFRFNDELEIHLYHKKQITFQDVTLQPAEVRLTLLRNSLRYCSKRKKTPSRYLCELWRYVKFQVEKNGSFDMGMWEECDVLFKKMKLM